ncbi:hypothetical protein [Virgibacillus pantothenticus]|uniref:hypothetical protein n=1 Tax=Virgibacillus pantothenticus TaxID=1473 RepID=UPI001C226989|nr:hypothetical protein [Virgibacillus pantothenticus]
MQYLYAFFERSMGIPFVITEEKVSFTFKRLNSWNYSKFFKLFVTNKVPHIMCGPDNQSLIYYRAL